MGLVQILVCRRYVRGQYLWWIKVSRTGQREKWTVIQSREGFSQLPKQLQSWNSPSELSCITHSTEGDVNIWIGILRQGQVLGKNLAKSRKQPTLLASGERAPESRRGRSGLRSSASPAGVNTDPCWASRILLSGSLKWETRKLEVGRQVYCSVRGKVHKFLWILRTTWSLPFLMPGCWMVHWI